MISKETITDIKQAVNIVDVIGETVALTKNGRNYLGLCPFHGEKTPSFNVVEDKQFYHCFGCGKSGDVFKFVEETQGISFLESVQLVAEKAGFELEESQARSSHTLPRAHPHQTLYEIHAEATKFYHALLMTTKMGEEARSYLHQRGLTDEVLTYFQIGLSPNEPDLLYRRLKESFSEQELLDTGLFNPSESARIYDAFQNRIMFPLTDDTGRILAFSGRIWTEADRERPSVAKYKNSRRTAIFNKSYELYHLDRARASIKKNREVYLMEGFMDVIAAYRAGIDNAVASMGTALTPEHVQHLRKYCQKIVLVYDGDKAGQAATAKALEELTDFSISIVSLPEGMDPDEFVGRYSEQELYQALTKSRISDVEFLMQYWKPENPDNLQMQIAFVDKMAPIIAKTKSITAQNSYIYQLADCLPDFDYQQVERAVNALRLAERQVRAEGPKPVSRREEWPQQVKITRLIRTENHLLLRMVEHPYILNDYRLREEFHFFTPELEVLYEILKKYGEITSADLANQEEDVQMAWYRVQEERLPEEVGPQELEELEATRMREYLKRQHRAKTRVIREQSHIGNEAAALDELTRLIAEKRKME